MPYLGYGGEKTLGSNSPRYLPTTSGEAHSKPDFSENGRWKLSNPDRHYDGYEAAVNAAYERTKVLLKWSIYYTACAILWTCMRINAPDDSTDASRVGTFQGPTKLGTQPLSQEELLKYWEGKYSKGENKQGKSLYYVDTVIAGVMTSLIIVLPIIVLAIVPGATRSIEEQIKAYNNRYKKNKVAIREEDTWNYETAEEILNSSN